MRLPSGLLLALVTTASGCMSLTAEDKPVYAFDNILTRPWVTCLATNVEEKDDGVSDAWTVGQAVADECAVDLLSAFRRETNEKDRKKAYALTAEKAVALVEANRRDQAAGLEGASGMQQGGPSAGPEMFGEKTGLDGR